VSHVLNPALARSFLFVPGDRPDLFTKAASSRADTCIIDLEDAVAPEDKNRAREQLARWLATGHEPVVRVNAADSPHFEADLALVGQHACTVMLPKTAGAPALDRVAAQLNRTQQVIALIETAGGVLGARDIAAHPLVQRLAFGNVDLAAQLAVDPDDPAALDPARSSLVLASADNGLASPVDGVWTSLDDRDGLRGESARTRRLGFGGKLCVHPGQVTPVNDAFSPTADDLRWAARLLDESTGPGAARVAGQMVDGPVLRRAERILLRATELGMSVTDTESADTRTDPSSTSASPEHVVEHA